MKTYRLRFPGSELADLTLGTGMHGFTGNGRAVESVDPAQAGVQLCIDRRGVQLRLGEESSGVHVNGRPVRRMAMLRAGDAIWLDGVEWLLLAGSGAAGAGIAQAPDAATPRPSGAGRQDAETRVVLRGIGGQHHGRCFSLDRPRTVGSSADCDIRIEDPALAGQHARLEWQQGQGVLRGLSGDGSQVNGEAVRDAALQAGDQLVFAERHRFLVEAPEAAPVTSKQPSAHAAEGQAVEEQSAADSPAVGLSGTARRLPWLLLAALLLAAALSLLLLFGAV